MSNQILVLVQCECELTEIKIYNHLLIEVARNLGSFDLYLDIGDYAVRYKVGPNEKEIIIQVPKGEEKIIVKIEKLDFKSFIPFKKNTFIEGEDFFYSSIKNLELSRSYFSIDNKEGSVLIFVHGEYDKQDNFDCLKLIKNFEIRNTQGERIYKFNEDNVRIGLQEQFFYVASNVFLEHGNYILRYETKNGVFDQIIHCADQWTTQIFFCADEGEINLKSQICIYDKFVDNFKTDDDSLIVSELLFRYINNHQIQISKDFLEKLNDKYSTKPFLLFYGVLNYIKDPNYDKGLVKWILGECVTQIGGNNDFNALINWISYSSQTTKKSFEVSAFLETPNSLVKIWDLFLNIYKDHEHLVPEDSLLSNVGARLVYLSSWLWWESEVYNGIGEEVKKEGEKTLIRCEINENNIQEKILDVIPSPGFQYALMNDLILDKSDHLIIDHVRKVMSPIEFYEIISETKQKFTNARLDEIYELVVNAKIENQMIINNYLVKGERSKLLQNNFMLTDDERCNEFLMQVYRKKFDELLTPKSIISNLKIPIYAVFRKIHSLILVSLRVEVFRKEKEHHSNIKEDSIGETNILYSDFDN